tara:strand:+ start:4145 stop:4981 length:837 start_codon:yes stop_codon:yes gene_type:complete
MEQILYGQPVANLLDSVTKNKIQKYTKKTGNAPTLTAITVGDNPASLLYVSRKEDKAKELGVNFNWIKLPNEASSEDVSTVVETSKKTSEGIIIQLPLPAQLNFEEIVNLIPSNLDIDGLTTHNLGYLYTENYKIIPATSLAVLELLKFYNIPTEDKNIVIAGRSRLVSSPLSKLLSNKKYNANVTVIHSRTSNLKNFTKQADIFISAVGKSKLFSKEYFKEESIVIDIGISNENGKNSGDVDITGLDNYLSGRSPFPGGIGPITVSALYSNLGKLIS